MNRISGSCAARRNICSGKPTEAGRLHKQTAFTLVKAVFRGRTPSPNARHSPEARNAAAGKLDRRREGSAEIRPRANFGRRSAGRKTGRAQTRRSETAKPRPSGAPPSGSSIAKSVPRGISAARRTLARFGAGAKSAFDSGRFTANGFPSRPASQAARRPRFADAKHAGFLSLPIDSRCPCG